MQLSPLQLREYSFSLFSVKARKDATPPRDGNHIDGVAIEDRIQWGIVDPTETDPITYGLKLYIGMLNNTGASAPYDIEAEIQGVFVLSTEIPKDKRLSLLVANGSAVLYSALREQVLTFTSRGVYGPLMLPTVNFLDRITKHGDGGKEGKS